MSTAAIVLCGGRSTRFGADKTRAVLEGRPLLDHVLDALPPDWPIVLVGPRRTTSRDVVWVRETPAFGGPLAALATGLARIETSTFTLIGADMPYAGATARLLAARLQRASDDIDTVIARTPDGRLQPLLIAARTPAGRKALPADPSDASLMTWLRRMHAAPHDIDDATAFDIDTPADLPPEHRS